ncbi:MAG: hypothetical protein PHQ23_12295, partial [Candidatus Wallbacteria bacterium]|nr:hypothetical protein [Candidatus Wallbacteria bacterium]
HLWNWDKTFNWNYQYYEDWFLYYIPYYDFWWMMSTYKDKDFQYYYWYSAYKTIDNWPANNFLSPMWLQLEITGDKIFNSADLLPSVGLFNGGCAFFQGPDSGVRFMARDYFADNFRSYDWSEVYPINWRENYFGPLYSDASPYYVGWWPDDAHQLSYSRTHRKDNSLTFNEYGLGVDFSSISWIDPKGSNSQDIMYNTYDMYQDQFRFSWTPLETGYYNIDMYFLNTTHSGNYMLTLTHRNAALSAPAILNLSEKAATKDSGDFNDLTTATSSPFDATIATNGRYRKLYLYANCPVHFTFSCLGGNKVRDVFTDNWSMATGSVFELYLDRIEISKVE